MQCTSFLLHRSRALKSLYISKTIADGGSKLQTWSEETTASALKRRERLWSDGRPRPSRLERKKRRTSFSVHRVMAGGGARPSIFLSFAPRLNTLVFRTKHKFTPP